MFSSYLFRLFKFFFISYVQEVGVFSMYSELGKRLINVIGYLNDIQVFVYVIYL